MRNQWEVKWWRVGLALAVLIAALWVGGFVFREWLEWKTTREYLQENHHLDSIPLPVPDKAIAKLDGEHLEQFEFSLQVPWKGVKRKKDSKSVSGVFFNDGESLLIFDPLTAVDSTKAIQGTAKNRQQADAIGRVFGARALSSNYDLMAAEMAVTSSQMKWWAWPQQNDRVFILLGLKSMEMRDANAIYEIGTDEMHGFQFGNPALSPYKVVLQLFDRNGRRYEIMISRSTPGVPIPTQAEVNAIVASIQPIPHS